MLLPREQLPPHPDTLLPGTGAAGAGKDEGHGHFVLLDAGALGGANAPVPLRPRVLGRSSSSYQQLWLYRSHGNASAIPLQGTPPASRPLWATSPGAKEQPPRCPEATVSREVLGTRALRARL